MMTRSGRMHQFLAMTVIIGLSAVSQADAHGGHGGGHSGGHSGGHAPRAPHFSGAQRSYKTPRMSRPAVSARGNNSARRTSSSGAAGGTHNAQARAMRTQALASNNRSTSGTASARGTGSTSTNALAGTTGTTSNGRSPNSYTYGTGNGARNYRAYGYGNGYRNRGYGRGYGYGRSQGTNREVVSRLRSVHSSLAQDRSRLSGAPRLRDACGFDGDPSALAPIDGLFRLGVFIRHEQWPGHGNATGWWRQQ